MAHKITSSSNPRIKEIVKLRDGKHRRRLGCFLIDGEREFLRAVQAGVEIVEFFVREDKINSFRQLSVLENVSIYSVLENVFEKIAFGNRNDGFVVVAREPDRSLEQFVNTVTSIKSFESIACPLIGVLEGVEKPGNIGAIFRSADGAGLDGVMLADPLCDLFNPNCIRGSLGTVFGLPASIATSDETIDWLRDYGVHLALARCDGAIPYTEYDFRQPTAIVLGSEADGLSDRWRGEGTTAISLPMHGVADSLNVSTAAAILFYEARRQRGVPNELRPVVAE